MPTVLTDVHLRTSLLVVVLMSHTVDFQTVTFQGASLCEGFLTKITFVRSNACMCPSVSLQVESVVESLATEGTEVSLHVAVALHVSIEQSL